MCCARMFRPSRRCLREWTPCCSGDRCSPSTSTGSERGSWLVSVSFSTPPSAGKLTAMTEANAHSVLVVEDDDGIRESIVEILRDEGYLVHEASNGREALEQLKDGQRPCVVLLDLMMPVMSGWQFLQEIQDTGMAD